MPGFNSKLVRLKVRERGYHDVINLACFNSKLVRLKVNADSWAEYEAEKKMFQFQTGSIKSAALVVTSDDVGVFQFQTGSIKRCQSCSLALPIVSNVSIPNWFD